MADSPMVPADHVRSFRQLAVWQQAMDLAVDVHRISAELPQHERFELGPEIRRSAASMPSNVAEGFSRHSRRAYRAHVAIGLGSEAELETQLELIRRLGYVARPRVDALVEQCGHVARLMQGLRRSLA